MTRSSHSRIVLLTRLPVPGRAKTRLASALGAQGAAALHRALTEHVATETRALAATGEAMVEVRHDGGSEREMRAWLGSAVRYRPQARGDLGARLHAAFADAFREGVTRCVAIGSDCPAMTADHLRSALAALDRADLVLGPATDGGYWLVGLRRAAAHRLMPGLFEDMSWGSAQVLRQTLSRAALLGSTPELLEVLGDVDRPEDLPEWESARDAPAAALRLSVVIPTLDEELQLGAAIRGALEGGASEVVVADGGSRDATREVALRAGARVVEAPRGRAQQLNAGAERASGDALLFLHADTVPPLHAAALVREALGRPGVVAGAFAYRAAARGALGLVLTAGGRARHLLSGHPYGDQGLFLRCRTFRALGGYPELPAMEDWELVARLRRLGRVVVLPEAAESSAASFVDHGIVRASLVNVAAIVGYQLGVGAQRIAGWRASIARRSATPARR